MTSKIYCSWIVTALAITILACTTNKPQQAIDFEQSLVQTGSPNIRLRAQNGATIEFQSHNGIIQQGSKPQAINIPHLVLFHNQELSEPSQRTLIIEVNGIQVPPSGATAALLLETQNGEPISSEVRWERIRVWQEIQQIPSQSDADLSPSTITFKVEFPENIIQTGMQVSTPTDYYRYQIMITDRSGVDLYTFSQEYALLLENQWITSLPDVPEESPGSAPGEIVIYYCDMTPFQKNIHDSDTWILREAVRAYVGAELLPRMVAAFQTQSQDWGFPWYQDWTSIRKGADAERISVALTDGKTWFHGQAFPRGNSKISINVSGGENYNYDSLTDGILSTFHHELFHIQQRNINQHLGGDGWISGKNDQWQFFAEGTAVLASSVAQPEIQFAPNGAERAYFANANLFIGSSTIRGDIGQDFSEINPYHSVLYWRFLYEQCGGMNSSRENPAAGMQIIRSVLVTLYQIAEGEAGAGGNLVDWQPQIMNQAFAGSACPFQTYRQSLAAFAQAVDALRFQTGHCQSPNYPQGCGFFDPHFLYNHPPADSIELIAAVP